MIDYMQVADLADMIINGYAFTKDNGRIRVLNLNCSDKSVVFDKSGQVLETSMDDIEMQIVKKYFEINKIQRFIKKNYQEMYLKWSAYSQEGFFGQ